MSIDTPRRKKHGIASTERWIDLFLNPLTLDEFRTRFLEQGPFHSPAYPARPVCELFSLEWAQRIVTRPSMRFPLVRAYRNGQRIDPIEFTKRWQGSGHVVKEQVNSKALFDLFASGATLNIRFVDRYVEQVLALCEQVAVEFQCRSHASVFLTPPNVGGVQAHYDVIDAFIVQIEGMKEWEMWNNDTPLPLRQQSYEADRVRAFIQDRKPDYVVIMKAGDVLYLPRGVIHQTRTLDNKLSLHLAIDIDPPRVHDVLGTMLDHVLDNLRREKFLRKYQISSRSVGIPTNKHEAINGFEELVGRFISMLSDDVFDRAVAKERANIGARKLVSIGRAHESALVNEHSEILISGDNFSLRILDEEIRLEWGDRYLSFPLIVRRAIEYVASQRKVKVSEIPNLDHDSATVMARRLVAEGFARRVR